MATEGESAVQTNATDNQPNSDQSSAGGGDTAAGSGAGGNDVERRLADIEKQNQELREANTRLERRNAETQEYAQRIITQLQAAAAAGGMADADQAAGRLDPRERLQEDPERFLDEHFQTRMTPLIRQNLAYQTETARTLFEQRYGEDDDYKAYKQEFDDFMSKIPPEVKANPAAWEQGLDFVRTKHLDEIIDRRSKRRAERQSIDDKRAFVEAPTGAAPSREKKRSLNDDEKAIAKGLGMSEDDYLHWSAQP